MPQSLEADISHLLDLVNRRDFEAVERMIDDDCVLDIPGGSRVIGRESARNSLSAYVLRRDVQLADIVVMTDATRQRGAAEVTFKSGAGRSGAENTGDGAVAAPAVFLFERDSDMFSRISLYLLAGG